MSKGNKWNLDLELGEQIPRQKLPFAIDPHPQSIAIVTPLVPEVSLYLPNDSETRKECFSNSLLHPSEPNVGQQDHLMDVLNRQNDQLLKLQNQIQRLLGENKSTDSTENKETQSCPSIPSQNSSTQTSRPPSPPPKQNYHSTNQIGVNTSVNWSVSSKKSQIKEKYREQSMVCGESVAMYENLREKTDEEVLEHYDQLLKQVQKLLSPPSSSVENSNHWRRRRRSVEAVNAAVNRVRQIGVSFISADDLAPPPQQNDYFDLPKENDDTSFIINSAALKYLSHERLSELKEISKEKIIHSHDYGLPSNYLSLATKEFLDTHKHIEKPHNVSQQSKPVVSPILDNISAIMKQPKLK